MQITIMTVGPLQTNCYLVEDDGELMIVDPGAEAERIMAEVGDKPVACIALTHGHYDHIDGLTGVAEATGAPIVAGAADVDDIEHPTGRLALRLHDYGSPVVSRHLVEGDTVEVGSKSFEVIETPGHTPGSICLYCAEEGVMFSGDTVFSHGRYGRTDFENSEPLDMLASLQKLSAKIPDGVKIFPGHEGATTMEAERGMNPYFS